MRGARCTRVPLLLLVEREELLESYGSYPEAGHLLDLLVSRRCPG